MSYYTERHGLRKPVERTYDISIEMYAVLFDCCSRYFDNIAWKYPEECPDGRGCCGLDMNKLSTAMRFEIPGLHQNEYGGIVCPEKRPSWDDTKEEYDQYALLDFIEFIYENIRDIDERHWHEWFHHHDISFNTSRFDKQKFRDEINDIFNKVGLLYTLSDKGMVERIVEDGVLSKDIEREVTSVQEPGLRDLLKDAIILYKTPGPKARQDSVEKIWDALERLKTYYTTMDKKASASKIVNDMASGNSNFHQLFDDEFAALTKIGNNFRIRHHETNKIDITDSKHYDYFFNRCLSLIALAVQYLK